MKLSDMSMLPDHTRLAAKDAASLLGIGESAFRKGVKDGRLPSHSPRPPSRKSYFHTSPNGYVVARTWLLGDIRRVIADRESQT